MTTEVQDECAKLAGLFEAKRAQGLLDVRFFLQNLEESAAEDICKEVNALYAADEAGQWEPLVFGDLAWRESPTG